MYVIACASDVLLEVAVIFLEMNPRAFHILDKYYTTEPHPQPFFFFLETVSICLCEYMSCVCKCPHKSEGDEYSLGTVISHLS